MVGRVRYHGNRQSRIEQCAVHTHQVLQPSGQVHDSPPDGWTPVASVQATEGRRECCGLAAVACHGHFNIREGQNISVLMTAPSLHELQQEEDRDKHKHCHFIPKGTRSLSNTYVPCVAAIRTGPGRPTGIGAATFSAGWGGGGKVKI